MSSVQWIFDPAAPSGARAGGLAAVHAFDPGLDTFVREVLQNSRDQRRGTETVRVTFTFNTLTGSYKQSFLNALSWDTLGTHIEAAANDGGVTIGPQLSAALTAASAESMVLLRVDDFGTNGLTGSEDDPYGNFNALCRNTLVTSETRKESGGSFGIGKSVLWRFSRFSTVLFSSTVSGCPEGVFRFIGGSRLPFHSASGENWDGPGWYGKPKTTSRFATRAESVWDVEARNIAHQLGLDRDTRQGPGTSILIVGFFEPGEELDRPVQDMAEDLLNSASRWFWPSMFVGDQPSLAVSVVIAENGNEVSRAAATVTSEVSPFVTIATRDSGDLAPLNKVGNVGEEPLEFKIPPHEDPISRVRTGDINAQVRLRVRVAHSGEKDHANRIALVRGSGMVVNYRPGRNPFGDQSYHAVLLAGTANDQSSSSHALEAFLRAAEPPSHNDWIATTDRIRSEYPRGARARINKLWNEVDITVAKMFDERPQDPTIGAPALARLLPLPGRGGGMSSKERFSKGKIKAELADGCWSFSGQVRCRRANRLPWKFQVSPILDGESGSGTELVVTDLLADECDVRVENGQRVCYVPSGITIVEFHGEATLPENDIPEDDLHRTRMKLRIRHELIED